MGWDSWSSEEQLSPVRNFECGKKLVKSICILLTSFFCLMCIFSVPPLPWTHSCVCIIFHLGNVFIIMIIVQLSGSSLKLQESCSALDKWGHQGVLSSALAEAQRTVMLLVPLSYLEFAPDAAPSRRHDGLATTKLNTLSSIWVLPNLPNTVHPLISFFSFTDWRTAPETQCKQPATQTSSWLSCLLLNHHHPSSHCGWNWSHFFISPLHQ